MTRYWLAVDGGNSKTDVLLGDGEGNVHAYVRGPGSSPQVLGLDQAVALIGRLIATAKEQAALVDAPFEKAELFLSGVDLPQEADLALAAVSGTGWAKHYRVENDTFALLRAGTDSADAVAVVCGAGINCVGRAAGGRTARFPALGMLSGDWGGGGHLASLVMWHACRGEDGRGAQTALSEAVIEHFGAATVAEVVAEVHLGVIASNRLDTLSELLFAVAATGDEVARRVVARQAMEIVALVTVAADRLHFRNSRYDVVLGGGVLRAQHPLLDVAVRDGIAAHSPGAVVTVLTQPPVIGAGLCALDSLEATVQSRQTLRHLVELFNQVSAAL